MSVINFEHKKSKFINDLKSARYWNRKIIEYNEQLVEVATKLYTIGSIDYSKPRTDYPSYAPPYALMDQEEKLIKKRSEAIQEINYLREILNELPKDIKKALIEMYVIGEKLHEDISAEIYLSRSSLYRAIDRCLSEVL